jgi:hypothetical protein
MSKFIEKLQQVFQPSAQSMGFQAAKAELRRPRIQLAVYITGAKTKTPVKEIEGPDAVVFPVAVAGGSKTLSGAWLVKGDAAEAEKAAGNGADFVIMPVSCEVMPPDNKIGKILLIESSITDMLLRTVNDLSVDAVLLAEDKENGVSFTWKRMMLIHRFSSILSKPLLIEVTPGITSAEMQMVWDAGISGVLLKTDAEQAETAAPALRAIIDKLSFPSKRKRDKSLAFLPRAETRQEEPEEDGDDGDDGDDS